ncbi:hypothetical protein HYX70_01560 [Candidatus Saccharibacteria bacterium]|nr:hypothetical protein [Candidatus Saccharibacteria bacterium]
MVKKIKSLLFAHTKGRAGIGSVKKAKLLETEIYLTRHRNLQPSEPAGFRSRSGASYYSADRF